MKDVLSATSALLDGIDAASFGKLFMIHRSKVRDPGKRFRIMPVEIVDDFADAFKAQTKAALEDIRERGDSIIAFSDPANASSYMVMDGGTLPDLRALLVDLEKHNSFHGSHDFDDVKEKGISCFVLKTDGGARVFAFFNVGKNHLDPNKYIVSKLTRKGLRLHKDKLVVFENSPFAVYYPSLEKILIVSYRTTKKLLDFREQFHAKCKAIIGTGLEGLVSIDSNNLDALLRNNTVNEKMVKMDSGGKFVGIGPDIFTRWNRFHEKTPLGGMNMIALDDDGRAIASKPGDLDMILFVLNGDIVEDVTLRNKYALATSKKELEVVHRQNKGRQASAGRSPAGRRRGRR